ncbi:tubulin monoglycylase TTLL3-like isoform X2 [Homalodisca vitripennis]|uniref:tubulin monoglycylase TTLL3-like isoform X2 n=1 Tax=Homalodisca vitripennis TaxID=197043 RepID=UPI001EEBB83A|nr:tubulin monoglycylase TTLL3-like isoform X2 [Homalodisca vitripennis]
MFSFEDVFTSRKRKFDGITSKDEPSDISVTPKIPKLTLFDSPKEATSDFRIRCGVQEYNVKRRQDVFLVQACSTKSKELQNKNSSYLPSKPFKTEEEKSKMRDSKPKYNTQKKSSTSAENQNSLAVSSCKKTKTNPVAKKESTVNTSSPNRTKSPEAPSVSNNTRSCLVKQNSDENKQSPITTNKTMNKRPANSSSNERNTSLFPPVKVVKTIKSTLHAECASLRTIENNNNKCSIKKSKEFKNALSQLKIETTQSSTQVKHDCPTTLNLSKSVKSVPKGTSDIKRVKSKIKEHPNLKKISKEILSTISQGIKRNHSNVHKNCTALSNTKSNAKTSVSSSNTSKTVVKEDHNSIVKRREFLASVNQAIRLQKVFMIGNQGKVAKTYIPVSNALKSRGWIDKYATEVSLEEEKFYSKMSELTTRRLQECDINFVWVVNSIDFGTLKENTIVSRFPKNTHFTTKVGLCGFLEQFYWFYEQDVSRTLSPRTLKITTAEDIDYFYREFGLSACVSLLKIVVEQADTRAKADRFFKFGEVPTNIVDFANDQCIEYIHYRQHNDIDRLKDSPPTPKEWTDFLKWFYKIVHESGSFKTTSSQKVQPYWPLLEVEGCKNLWLVKPAAQVCGKGIKVMRTLEDIVNHVDAVSDGKMGRYVVQKYIESPLLIYNTKFDIRQWFLVTSVYPLTIWFYNECYLRFASQPFSLVNLHESIHLTNNAIQKNYTNCSNRNENLPEENMWHSSKFQDYLSEIGHADKWKTVILPGMKQGIVGAVLASQDDMVDRANSFELYGADFLLGIDYIPILLEINMGPAMHASTKVTAEICKSGLEDVIKVVLDTKRNPKADTGKFEMLYKQELGPRPHHTGELELLVAGTKIVPDRRVKK